MFFIEWDKIDQEQYFLKILFGSFEQDGISQKLNLAHAWSPVQTDLNSKCDIILMRYVSLEYFTPQSGPVIKQYFLLNELERCFLLNGTRLTRKSIF